MFRFRPIEMHRFSCCRGRYSIYGILAEQQTQTGWIIVAMAADVTYDWDYASQLAEFCTRSQADPQQLLAVIESFRP